MSGKSARAAAIFSSPLQIGNAAAALADYGVGQDECLKFFLPGANVENRTRCEKLLASLGWAQVITIDSPAVSQKEAQMQYDSEIFSSLSVLQWITKNLPARLEYVFLGDYRPRMFIHILNLIKPLKTVILDDGSIVPEFAEYRLNYLNPLFKSEEISKHRENKTLTSFSHVRFDLDEAEAVEFFTIYRLKLPLQDSVRRNLVNRNCLAHEKLDHEKCVWIIGTNHVEEGITKLVNYATLLAKIVHFYRGQSIVYYSHRREDPQKVLDISTSLNIQVVQAEEGVEAELIKKKKQPQRIATIVSTVTDTMGDIWGGAFPVDCFLPDKEYLAFKRKEHIHAIISYQRLNQHRNTNFWNASGDDRGGYIDQSRFKVSEIILASGSPLVGIPLDAGCSWINQEGFFERDIEVEIESATGKEIVLVATDLSQPYFHAGDEFFLMDSKGGKHVISLEQVRGLRLRAKWGGSKAGCESADSPLKTFLLKAKVGQKVVSGAMRLKTAWEGATSETKSAPKLQLSQKFFLRPRWRCASFSPGKSNLPIGLPLGTGARYVPVSDLSLLGLEMGLTGGVIRKMNGFVLDPWGQVAENCFTEKPEGGIHSLKFLLKKSLAEGEHLSFIIKNGGRDGICLRFFQTAIEGTVGHCFVDLTKGKGETVSRKDTFSELISSISVDKLRGNWLRITFTAGTLGAKLAAVEFVLQNKFKDSATEYVGKNWRGLVLSRVSRAFGSTPLLPVYSEARDKSEADLPSQLQGKKVAGLNLVFSHITSERRFVVLKINGAICTLDLNPALPMPEWIKIKNSVSIPLSCEKESTATLHFTVNEGMIEVYASDGRAKVKESKVETFDFQILGNLLGENVCPFLVGLDVFQRPIREVARTRCLFRSKPVPADMLSTTYFYQPQ